MGSYFTRTFYSLEDPRFRTFWFGTLFSFLGMQMQMIARGFLAYDLTGKNTALGGVMIAFGLPQLLLSLWGGVLADRVSKRKILWIAQSIIAINSAWLAVMIALDMMEYWMLIFAGVVQGGGFAFVGPARQAYIGDMVSKDALGNAVVLQQFSMNSTRVIGPSIAGAMIAIPFVGIAGVYMTTTIGFVIAMVSLINLPPGSPKPGANARSPIGDLTDGIRYVCHQRAIGMLILASFAIIMIGFPYQSFLPSVAKSVYDVGGLGLGILSSVGAVGAVAATMYVASAAGKPQAWTLASLSGIAFGVSLIGLGAAPTFAFGMAAMVFVGAFAASFQSLNNSLCMQMTEPEYTGRVQSINMMSWSLFGLAALPIGILADHIGIRETLAVLGGLCVISIIAIEGYGRLINIGADREAARSVASRPRRVPAGGR